jgi:hypothetical protein
MGNGAEHFAIPLPARRFDAVLEEQRAGEGGAETWTEDHPAERTPGIYLVDPSGNRVQLTRAPAQHDDAPPGALIDHVSVEVNNFDYAEYFYGCALGASVDYHHGWRAADYAVVPEDDGDDDLSAPWTRRDRGSYRDRGRRILRPNAQVYYRFGSTRLGLFIATAARQQPPEEVIRGTPRIALRTSHTPGEVESTLRAFPFRFERSGWRIFLRDPSGNFVELECQGP